MALYSVFIAVLMFNLSMCLSDGKFFGQFNGLLRGFVAREARSAKQPEKERDLAEVPRFLLDLYRKRTHLPRGRLNEEHSDIVRVFLLEPTDGKDEHKGPLHHSLFFNLTTFGMQEKIRKAELRIYKKKSLGHGRTEGKFKISLFRLKRSQDKSISLKNIKVLVASRLVSCKDNTGKWITFDVTSAVNFWKENPKENLGVSLTVQGMRAFASEFRVGSRGRRAPFLVTYTENPRAKVKSSEKYRNCSNNQVSEEGDYLHQNASSTPRNRAKRSAFKTCRRRWVYVQFKKLKWNWIIAPSGYSANYCEGTCLSVLNMHIEPTNHAILQNILHRMDSRIPSPSCAPTKLHGISVLYKTSDRSIALTEYGGMVVSTAKQCILQGAQLLRQALGAKQRTLVHCEWGQNRSGSICCAFAVLYLGWSASAAIRYFREQNLVERHYSGQSPMSNSAFNKLLEEIERDRMQLLSVMGEASPMSPPPQVIAGGPRAESGGIHFFRNAPEMRPQHFQFSVAQ